MSDSVVYTSQVRIERVKVRVHEFHADFCPVARSIGGCIDISTELTFEAL